MCLHDDEGVSAVSGARLTQRADDEMPRRRTPQCIAPMCCVKGQHRRFFTESVEESKAARVLHFFCPLSSMAGESHAVWGIIK